MTVLDVLIEIVIVLSASFAVNKFLMRKWKKPIEIVVHPHVDNWIDIKKTPIPFVTCGYDIYPKEIITTCGKKVDTSCIQRYNSKGELTMGYANSVITHWQPLPKPPGIKDD